jgi:hypothetical protein
VVSVARMITHCSPICAITPFEAGCLQEQFSPGVDKAEADSLVPMDSANSIEPVTQISCLATRNRSAMSTSPQDLI